MSIEPVTKSGATPARDRPSQARRRRRPGPVSARSSRSGGPSSPRSSSTILRPTSTRSAGVRLGRRGACRAAAARSGEPYVTHPIASAQILAELGIDPVAVEAALLHDVPEDTEYSLADIEERFGPEVARLVDGVTKLSKFSTHTHEQQQAENIRKMFLAMAEDIRVVLIKLADRLHNMRTLAALPLEKQQRIARQTMEIYAPLAERLGIWQIKWELEDLAFKALEPERFRELAKLLDTRRRAARATSSAAIAELRPRARGGRHRGRSPGPPEAHLQHLQEDAAQGRRSSARSTTSTRSACSSRRSRTATRRSASCTRCGGRSRASSTTTSPSPRTTSTRASTPR